MKEKVKYISLIAVFIIFIFSITITNLLLKYDEKGSFNYFKEYYEIRFNNIKINYDIDTTIKVNNNKNYLHFEINDLNDYIEEKVFYIDMNNLGNKKAFVKNAYLSNFDTNAKEDDLKIEYNIENGEEIKGGETKRLIVKLKYKGKNSKDKKYYKFNLNYDFEKYL